MRAPMPALAFFASVAYCVTPTTAPTLADFAATSAGHSVQVRTAFSFSNQDGNALLDCQHPRDHELSGMHGSNPPRRNRQTESFCQIEPIFFAIRNGGLVEHELAKSLPSIARRHKCFTVLLLMALLYSIAL